MKNNYTISNQQKEVFEHQVNSTAMQVAMRIIEEKDFDKPKLNSEVIKQQFIALVMTLTPSDINSNLDDYTKNIEDFITKYYENGDTIKGRYISVLSQKMRNISAFDLGGLDKWNEIKNHLAKSFDDIAKVFQEEHQKYVKSVYDKNPSMRKGAKIVTLSD